MKMIRYIGLFLFFASSLSADFQQIQIKWTSGLCGSDCIKNLQREFSKIPGFQEASFGNSQVTLKWKPGAPFSFQSINAATRMVGIRLQDVRIKVSGTVAHDKNLFFLISSGDGTRIQLLGPVSPDRTGYTTVQNVETHELRGSLQTRLLDAEKEKAVVVVEGPLFMPFQMPDLRIIAESVKTPRSNDSESNQSNQPNSPATRSNRMQHAPQSPM